MSSGFTDCFQTIRADDLMSQADSPDIPPDYLTYIRQLQENKKLEKSFVTAIGLAANDGKFRRKLSELPLLEETLKKSVYEKKELVRKVNKLHCDVECHEQIRRDLERKIGSLETVCQSQEQLISELKKTLELKQNEINEHNQIAKLIHDLSDSYLNRK